MTLHIYSPEVREAMLQGLLEEETRTLGRLFEQHRKLKTEFKELTDRITLCQMTRTGLINLMSKTERISA